MNIALQLEGERIAQQVTARSKALEVLSKRQGPFKEWHYFLLALLGIAGGYGVFAYMGTMSQPLIAVVACVGFFMGCAAFQECVMLRRRLDAALVLLRDDMTNSNVT